MECVFSQADVSTVLVILIKTIQNHFVNLNTFIFK